MIDNFVNLDTLSKDKKFQTTKFLSCTNDQEILENLVN